MKKKRKIGIIGCGNMGEALIKGLIKSGLIERKDPLGCEINSRKLKAITKKYRIKLTKSATKLVRISDIIILAVKPQGIKLVLKDIACVVNDSKLIISIAAGITTNSIEGILKGTRVIRVMPNTPALVGEGMSAICLGRYARKQDGQLAFRLLSSVGEVIMVKEKLMDTVTAISGSGPAYFFYLMEALIDVAKKQGLSQSEAKKLVLQTALGASSLAAKTKKDPRVLRKSVTSKGGTTQAAISVFKKKKLDKTIKEAVKAAIKKSKQLSGG